jgi:hypothetical protein
LVGLVAANEHEQRYHAAERRLRNLLFGDGTYNPGIVKGEEHRGDAARELRFMREAFDEVLAGGAAERSERAEARIADLEEELRRLAAASRKTAVRRRKAS